LGIGIKRRELISLLGGVAVAWPLAARAQQAGKLPTIGFMGTDATIWSSRTDPFVQRLRELGWIEGRTITIEYRWDEGRPERSAEFAAEFVRFKVDVIVTYGIAVPAVKKATAAIPIVFAIAIDPVGSGLVASLARPGGNVTGLSFQGADLAGKRLEILREVVPNLRRLVIMASVGVASPEVVLEMGKVQAAARTFGIEVAPTMATHAISEHGAEGYGLKCHPRRLMTSSVTGARPEKPNTRAAADVTSMTRRARTVRGR
jgi:putative ABC transport system substrate-binding protein